MPTLEWIGKSAVVKHHQEIPYRLLHCESDVSVGDSGHGNLLVEGDNLLALKALLPYYAKQVKCIYIDPPYNTGNEDWVYNDNVNSPEIRKWLGETVGREAEDFSRHDKWLCMMYPRLALLWELLREDGAIFVSIDDTEVAGLRCIMDEIFGRTNFIANIVWQKKQSPQNDSINFSDMHDHVLVYAKRAKASRNDPYGWQRHLLPRGEMQESRYSNPDADPRGPWTSVDYTCNKSADDRPNLYYAIVNPNTGEEIWPSRHSVWRYDRATHQRHLQEHRVWWGTNGRGSPRLKRFLSEVAGGVVPSTWWDRTQAGDNQEARRELRGMFGQNEPEFSTPKPTRLVKRILQVAADKGALVLDSFAGSGTTGHAVLQLNREDGGNRRFILVEMEQEICRRITAERIRRVIGGYGHREGLGGGFRYCTLGEPLFDARGQISEVIRFDQLARHIFFTETGEPLPGDVDESSSLIGVSKGTAYYLLWNGRENPSLLDARTLTAVPKHEGPRVVYADECRLPASRLKRANLTFKQIPYEIKVR